MTGGDDEVLIELTASGPRRLFACASMGLLGMLLLWLAVLTAPAFLWAAFFAACGLGVIYLSWWQFKVTEGRLVLTRRSLTTSTGLHITDIEDVSGVDRGALTFKPSQGFLLRTRTPAPRAWAPGLYWRLGRSIGVGGVTNAGQGKAMAEMIQAMVAEKR